METDGNHPSVRRGFSDIQALCKVGQDAPQKNPPIPMLLSFLNLGVSSEAKSADDPDPGLD